MKKFYLPVLFLLLTTLHSKSSFGAPQTAKVFYENLFENVYGDYIGRNANYMTERKKLKKKLKKITKRIRKLEEYGKGVTCVNRMADETKWFIVYTADFDSARQHIRQLEKALPDPDKRLWTGKMFNESGTIRKNILKKIKSLKRDDYLLQSSVRILEKKKS